MDFNIIAGKLVTLRSKIGLKQSEASQRAGISVSNLSDLETGKANNPMLMSLVKLCTLYGVPITYLLDENQDEYKPFVEPFTTMIANVSQEKAQKIIKIAEIVILD